MKLEGLDGGDADVDLYGVLNVSSHVSTAEIQRSYKKLSRVFHPDKQSSGKDDDAQKTFLAVKQAHDVLADPILRLAYDVGGLLAVALIKRSQAASHSQAARRSQQQHQSETNNRNEEDDFDEYEAINLYSELQAARSQADAAAIVQEALEEYRWHMSQHHAHKNTATRTSLGSNMELSHTFSKDASPSSVLEREFSSLQFQSSRQIGTTTTVTLGATSQVQPNALTDVNTSLGLAYQPNRGTNVSVDTVLLRAAPQVSIRTSRQMGNGTFWVVGLAGSLATPHNSNSNNKNNWNYSLISYRNILWEHPELLQTDKHKKEPIKVQASWRLGLRPTTGQVQSVMATLKTLQFPQWTCRLGLGAFPLKISYQAAETNAPYLAYSWGVMCWRLKLAWLWRPSSRWKVKYGIKYDGRALFSGDCPWVAVFQVSCADEWTLSLPIGLRNELRVVPGVITVLLCQWIEKLLEDLWGDKKAPARQRQALPLDGSPLPPPPQPVMREVIATIALEKQKWELEQPTGLVIRHATWRVATTVEDVTDVLQYWVVDGKLNLPPMHDNITSRSWLWSSAKMNLEPETDNEAAWWHRLRNFWSTPTAPAGHRIHGELNVRYQCSQRLYEISFDADELVWLPNKRATEMGEADKVS